MISSRPLIAAIVLLVGLLIYPQFSDAQTYDYDEATQEKLEEFERKTRIDDSLTIGQVAALEPAATLAYVVDATARRGLELGILHGGDVLQCLGNEFRDIKQKVDGSWTYPRGLNGAITLLHRHNNNGRSDLNAVTQLNHIVDLVGHYACGLEKPQPVD